MCTIIKRQAQSLEYLDRVILDSKVFKYERAIQTAIDKGAKYKELLKIDPKDFNIPATYSQIKRDLLYTIAYSFCLNESNIIHPDLRDIAEELEAPYSVILEAKKLFN